jgi:hypothetical protein
MVRSHPRRGDVRFDRRDMSWHLLFLPAWGQRTASEEQGSRPCVWGWKHNNSEHLCHCSNMVYYLINTMVSVYQSIGVNRCMTRNPWYIFIRTVRLPCPMYNVYHVLTRHAYTSDCFQTGGNLWHAGVAPESPALSSRSHSAAWLRVGATPTLKFRNGPSKPQPHSASGHFQDIRRFFLNSFGLRDRSMERTWHDMSEASLWWGFI